jgi:transcription elongation factor Elf1
MSLTEDAGDRAMTTIDCPCCEHEHAPSGDSKHDTGERTCEECGFRFVVEVAFKPAYSTRCVTHLWSDWKSERPRDYRDHRYCTLCMADEIRPHVEGTPA